MLFQRSNSPLCHSFLAELEKTWSLKLGKTWDCTQHFIFSITLAFGTIRKLWKLYEVFWIRPQPHISGARWHYRSRVCRSTFINEKFHTELQKFCVFSKTNFPIKLGHRLETKFCCVLKMPSNTKLCFHTILLI